jgi:ABC-type multidrug transport system ATPase subunit
MPPPVELETCRKLIAGFQIERATNLLMDVCKRDGRRLLRSSAILLTARWTRIAESQRRLGDNELLRANSNQLIADLLDFIDEFEMKWSEAVAQAVAPAPADDLSIQVFERANYTDAKQSARSANKGTAVTCSCSELTFRRSSMHGVFDLHADPFSFKTGTITAMVGANGSGKSTLLSLLAGDLMVSKGKIDYCFDGNGTTWYQRKNCIAFVRQHPEPWAGRLADTLRFESACAGYRSDELEQEVSFVLHRLRLERFANSSWSSLSGGYRTRFELARAILREPMLLLLDEPLAHLDMNAAESFLQDLADVTGASEQPIATVISSQHIYEMEALADTVIFVNEGRACYAPTALAGSVFELQCDVDCAELIEIIEELHKSVRIESHSVHRLSFPQNCSSAELLQHLLVRQVEVRYFREISSSTRRLL